MSPAVRGKLVWLAIVLVFAACELAMLATVESVP